MIKKFFLLILFLFIIFWLYFWNIYQNSLENSWEFEKKISMNIPLWTPVKKIVQTLYDKWILKEKWTFYLYIKINTFKLENEKSNFSLFNWLKEFFSLNLKPKIQAWDFIFDTPIWLNNLFKQLWNAKQEETRVIVPEGSTVDDIDNILSKKWLIEDWDFIECAKNCEFSKYNFFFDWDIEWYLFPDTYFVPTDTFTSKSFAKRMFDNFQRKVLKEDFKNEYKKQWKTLKEIIIMASMIERESRFPDEMKIISWILRKRIDEWMALWVDATTRYYKKSKQWVLTAQDFKKDNPYNTRKYLGLTPTAISNPWIDAITASLYPEKSPYYFYLHWNDFEIHYWKTNSEHNLNKFKFLK